METKFSTQRRKEAKAQAGNRRGLERSGGSAAVSPRPAAAGTNVARSMDLTCASLLAKPLRLIPRGARHSRAPGRCADAPLEFSYSFCAFASWRLCVKSGRVG